MNLSWRDHLANLKCQLLDALGFAFCTSHARWYRKRNQGDLDGLCKSCSVYVEIDRTFRTAGYSGAPYREDRHA